MNIRFYFDPICPWCWITSRWLKSVESERDLNVEWMPFSLALKNDEDLEAGDSHVFTHKLLRLGAHIKNEQPELMDEFYTISGSAVHLEEMRDPEAIANEVIDQLDLDQDLLETLENSDYDSKIVESMQTGLDVVGDDVGTPIILFETDDGWNGFFGPVLDALPDEQASLKLWDGLSEMATNQHFYELKRTRTSGPNTDSTA